jgi:hypothetical protein
MLLNDETYKRFTVESYTHDHCLGLDEYKSDVIKLIRVNRLADFYVESGYAQNEGRILLNSIVSLLNVFEHKALVRLIIFKAKKENYSVFASIFEFLSILPKSIPEVDNINKYVDDKILRKLKEGLV